MPSPTDIEETFVFNFVGDGFLHVPKRHLYINLKFGHPFFQNNPIFPLDLPVEALDKLYFSLLTGELFCEILV